MPLRDCFIYLAVKKKTMKKVRKLRHKVDAFQFQTIPSSGNKNILLFANKERLEMIKKKWEKKKYITMAHASYSGKWRKKEAPKKSGECVGDQAVKVCNEFR